MKTKMININANHGINLFNHFNKLKSLFILLPIGMLICMTSFISTSYAQCDPIQVIKYAGNTNENHAEQEAIAKVTAILLYERCPLGCWQPICFPPDITQTVTVTINDKDHYLKQATSTCECGAVPCPSITVTRVGWDKEDASAAAETEAKANADNAAANAECPRGCIKGTCEPATVSGITFFDQHVLVEATATCPCVHARLENGEGNESSSDPNRIYPNPSNGHLNVEYFSDGKNIVQLVVYDGMGRALLIKSYEVTSGSNSFEVDATGLDSGIYLMVIKNNTTINSMKFMIEN